jgi:hypothetical protein
MNSRFPLASHDSFPGERVEVKIHRAIADVSLPLPRSAGETVLTLPTGEDARTETRV